MPAKRHSAEQIVRKLREAEVELAVAQPSNSPRTPDGPTLARRGV